MILVLSFIYFIGISSAYLLNHNNNNNAKPKVFESIGSFCEAQNFTIGNSTFSVQKTKIHSIIDLPCPSPSIRKARIYCEFNQLQQPALKSLSVCFDLIKTEKAPITPTNPITPTSPTSNPTTPTNPITNPTTPTNPTQKTPTNPITPRAGSQVDNKKKTLLIAVETAPSHFKARSAILSTWASSLNPLSKNYDPKLAQMIEIKFFIGLLAESDKNLTETINIEPNIVRLKGFVESYGNLSAKTLGIIKWSNENGYQHLLKVDDDVFLQLEHLQYWLKDNEKIISFGYGGEFVTGGGVVQNPKSKWYMADQYPKQTFPDYAFGSTYFLGKSLVEFLALKSDKLPLYRVEDAGVAIWLQDFPLQIERIYMENMFFQAECWDEFAIFTTPVNANEMFIIQENKMKYGSLCGNPAKPYVLEECVTRRCRCYPIPDGDACDVSTANEEYKDLIPRLL